MNKKSGGATATYSAPAAGGGGGGGGYTLEEVAKHITKDDCWVVVNGQVMNVTNFLKDHPGGELAILTFAGKDASEEFNMIHPPDVIGKYAPDAVIGQLGAGASNTVAAAAGGDLSAPLLAGAAGEKVKNYEKMNKNRKARMEKEGKIGGWLGALCYMVLGFMTEIIFTIFGQKNIILTNDRSGVTRSAMFLFIFIIIHAIGNLHVFLGPDDFNGYGYFYVRLYPTGFGFQANIVEEYVLLAALLHVSVALRRTWDISINYTIASGKLNLAISGVTLLTFMSIHLFQFRFGVTDPYVLCPPPYFVNVQPWLDLDVWHMLNLFWTQEPGCKKFAVRDIYKLEFSIFKSAGWCWFYICSVVIFCIHPCLGWQKVVPSPQLDIPKRHHNKAIHIGYCLTAFVALIYVSFPIYAHEFEMAKGAMGQS